MKNFCRIIKVAAVIIGVLLILGAVGNGDFYGYFTASDGIHILLGFALVAFFTIARIVAESKEE